MTKKLFKKPVFPFVALIAILFGLVFSISLIDRNDVQIENMQPETDISFKAGDANNEVPLDSTLPKAEGQIIIDDIGTFSFNPAEISSERPDVFKQGYFSIFDILVFLDATDQIKMDYEFSEEFQTHIIYGINEIPNWWYLAFYDGGWAERNVWRRDLFPYIDKSTIRIHQIDELSLFNIYNAFSKDAQREISQKPTVEIPEVIIRGEFSEMVFNNVKIEPHNLRDDYFIDGTITAIDAILTLSDQGLITTSIKWHETIGSAGIVKNYFVDEINDDKSVGRCGFVYELGEQEFLGFRGNHIHIPSDLRVIDTIPEYIEYFWICI